jgi:hypothetical protein
MNQKARIRSWWAMGIANNQQKRTKFYTILFYVPCTLSAHRVQETHTTIRSAVSLLGWNLWQPKFVHLEK